MILIDEKDHISLKRVQVELGDVIEHWIMGIINSGSVVHGGVSGRHID